MGLPFGVLKHAGKSPSTAAQVGWENHRTKLMFQQAHFDYRVQYDNSISFECIFEYSKLSSFMTDNSISSGCPTL